MNEQPMSTEIPDGAVMVGVDGSEHALAAVRWAAEEAASRRGVLAIAHAAPNPRPAAGPPVGIGHARSIISQANAEASGQAGAIRVSPVVLAGDPVPALTSASASAALLVLGMTGSGGLDDILLGSTTLQVSGQARCPVVGVRRWPPTRRPDPLVVLGLSTLPADAPAVEVAFELANRRGWELAVVHTHHPGPGGNDRHHGGRQALADHLAGWSRRYPAVTVGWRFPSGPPEKALLELGGRAEVIVTGSRRRGPAARALLGSTSRAVLRHSPAPVIVAGPDSVTAPPDGPWYVTEAPRDPHALGQLW
ncbi:universal stress protein [Pseudonocardia acaciae]|uniref:universal stress protein n=1 Tax=Pseudonocardia acaciae TaxID=551276 RepID=UPI000AE44E28|nr:universal stress protein [Pseudonocardia acaciae]